MSRVFDNTDAARRLIIITVVCILSCDAHWRIQVLANPKHPRMTPLSSCVKGVCQSAILRYTTPERATLPTQRAWKRTPISHGKGALPSSFIHKRVDSQDTGRKTGL